jgi:hypothetical protein
MLLAGQRRPRGHGVTAPGDSPEERRRKWLAYYHAQAGERGGACLSTAYRHAHGHLHWRCAEGHEWRAEANAIRHGEWCPECAWVARPARQRARMFARVLAIARRHGGACVSTEYVNSQSHLRWRCAEGHEWDAVPGSITTGTWCPHCAGRTPLTIADMHEVARDRGGLCLSRTYHNTQTPMRWRCAEGHEWTAKPAALRQGSWCPRCSPRARHTLADIQAMAAEHGGECLSTTIDGNRDVLRLRCRVGHVFESNVHHLVRGNWCHQCRQMPRGTLERLQQTVSRRGGSLLESQYRGSVARVHVRCGEGHEWLATPQNLLSGHWCRECWRASKVGRSRPKLGILDMQEVAKRRGGRCLSDTYINAVTRLRWQCHDGHEWDAPPAVIRSGHWCPQCAHRHRGTIDAMRALAAERGGECHSRVYQNHNDPLLFTCARGHSFIATGMAVKSGVWCLTCGDRDAPAPTEARGRHPGAAHRAKPTRRAKTPSAPAAAEYAQPPRGDREPSPPVPPTEVTRDYLMFIGIRSRTVDLWLRDGVLLATSRFHVYRRTPEANHRIAARLAR